MCVSHGKAHDKTNMGMIIKHQLSLEEMIIKVLEMSFQHELIRSHTQTTKGFTSLKKMQSKIKACDNPMVKIENNTLIKTSMRTTIFTTK